VPLQFNKLDLRDYLYHAYDVEVTAVRSFINQPAPRQKHGSAGRFYRPRSQKMMIAELVKPFVWPEPPAKKDREAFDYDMFERLSKERQKSIDQQTNALKTPLRPFSPIPVERTQLKEEAAQVLKTGKWKNKKDVDEDEWTEVEKEVKI
jgi:large subunit ribosomal protein L23